MANLDYSPDIWRKSLSLVDADIPRALILEGTWWREKATVNRLARLENVRELDFPDMYIGEWRGVTVAYCCAYGAARAVEPAHIFAQLGTPLLIQIGTCGILNPSIRPGTVTLPEFCEARDGISSIYGAADSLTINNKWIASAERLLQDRGVDTKRTRHLTWPSLFAQSREMCDTWAERGIESIDMETTTVVGVADYFNASAVSMLSAWDVLEDDKTFLDPLSDSDSARLKSSNNLVFDVALSLAAIIQSESATR